MLRKFSTSILFILLTLSLLSNGCGNKEEQDTSKKEGQSSGTLNSDLIVKDEKGSKVTLSIKPKKGEAFRYKMNAVTTSKEKGPMTSEREITSTQDINYYYSEEVNDVAEGTGIITYKIKFDSINIVSTVSSADSTIKIIYNSNVKDSVYLKPDFIQYNAIMNEEFFARVSPKGEISEIYGLEKVYENMFKALGDTLNESQKESLKSSFGKEAIQAVLQQQFQVFPDTPVYKDSTWSRSYETQIMIFPVKNILSYKLSEIKEENKQLILKIEADLTAEFINKDIKEEKVSYKIEGEKTGGKGTIEYNLSRGCVISKQTTTNIDLDMKISSGGQSVKTKQAVSTALNISLLQ